MAPHSPKPQIPICEIEDRPIPLPDDLHYPDLVDAADSMMSAQHPRLPTRREKWDGRKATVLSGDAIVCHLQSSAFAAGRTHGVSIAQALVRAGAVIPTFRVQSSNMTFVAVADSTYVHRGLTSVSDYGLNVCVPFTGDARAMLPVLRDVAEAFGHVLTAAVSPSGHFVDYGCIRGCKGWRRILVLLAELADSSDSDMHAVSDSEKRACFFNLYNVLIFHAKLAFGHPTDLVKRGKFFNDAAYLVAGKRVTSVELEHLVLRGRMQDGDSRIGWRVSAVDARMHFVLNCGAQSCPPLTAVPVPVNGHVEALETSLDDVTLKFIDKNVGVDVPGRKVVLSRLFKWFRGDFTPRSQADDVLLMWVAQRASPSMCDKITEVVARGGYKVKFDVYNWADNGDVTAKPDVRFMAVYDLSFARSA